MSRLNVRRRKVKSPAVTGPGGFPRRFDNYVLLKPLARGGMGQLFLALTGTHGLEKLCVIKQVIPDLVASENSRRFRDEAMVALRLAHGNMVSVFDAGIDAGQIFLAMEYVDGKDLLGDLEPLRREAGPLPGRHRGLHRQGGGAGAGLRARLRGPQAGPPRRLAGQRAALLHRRGQADRLRSGDVDPQDGAHHARDRLRQALVPLARAGAAAAARRAGRHLRRGHPALGAADRPAALPHLQPRRSAEPRRDGARPQPRGGAAVEAHQPRAARARSDRDARAGRRARGPLPERRAPARRSRRLPGRDGAQDRRRPPGRIPAPALRRRPAEEKRRARAPDRRLARDALGRHRPRALARAGRGRAAARLLVAPGRPPADAGRRSADRDHAGRALPHPAPVRRGGDGARLRGAAHRHRPAGRHQDPARELSPQRRSGRKIPARGARRLQDRPPQHRRRDRLGHHARRRLLLRHGVPRRDRTSRSSSSGTARSPSSARCSWRRRSRARWRRRTPPR